MISRRLFGLCVWLVLAACLTLALDRLRCAVSFTTPWQITTSSPEEEALFPIWKFAHGQAVYNDPTQPPFSLSDYNWLFYDFYGAVAALFLRLLHLGDIWLPNIARLLTLFFTLAASAFYFAILRRNGALRDLCPAYPLAALSLIATLNPLFGFWVMTARPDIGALALELAGLFLLVIHLRRPRLVFPLLAGLVFYLAWSFKQTAVTGLAAGALTLFLNRRPTDMALMVLPWIALVALTLFLGGSDYRYSIFVPQTEFGYHLGKGLVCFFSNIAKMPLIGLALVVLIVDAVRLARAGKLASLPPEETLLLLATVIALVFDLALVGKESAAENHLFTLSAWSGLWLLWALPRLGGRFFSAACIGITALMVGGIALVLLGRIGLIDRRAPHHSYLVLAEKLRQLPTPVYVASTYGNLPWIQPNPPYFVVTEVYAIEKSAGAIPPSRSLDALMERGYFGTIVLYRDAKPGDAILARYELGDRDLTYDYYVRK